MPEPHGPRSALHRLVASGALSTALCLALAVAVAAQVPAVQEGGTQVISWSWVPSLELSLAFRIDGLSVLFALLVSGVGAVVMVYSGAYMAHKAYRGRFFLFMTAFMLAMMGLVTAEHLLLLYVFWELTTLTSYLLIGWNHDEGESRAAALQALLVTALGGLCMLAGLILMGIAADGWTITAVRNADDLTGHPFYPAILILILLGAFTKSAQVPFHFWLPNAMAAPTPVSAYLHSAAMVKAGIYLLARFHPVLAGTPAWETTLATVGVVSALTGAVLALRETDMKRILAYSTIMGLGVIVSMLAGSTKTAVSAAMTFLVVHALYKAALFLVAGAVDHGAGSRDIRRLGHLARPMPLTAAATVLAALSMSGFPPFLGFIGKELQYEAALVIAGQPPWLVLGSVLANAFMTTAALILVLRPFFTAPEERCPQTPHEGDPRLAGSALLLAVAGFVLGVMPELFGNRIIEPAVIVIEQAPRNVDLKLWHGVNVPLVLSIITVLVGISAYVVRRPIRRGLQWLKHHGPIHMEAGYDRLVAGLQALAAAVTGTLQHGRLAGYAGMTLLSLVLLPTGIIVALGGVDLGQPWRVGTVFDWVVLTLAAAAAIATVAARTRLAAIGAVAFADAAVALLFVLFGGPDLALTQLAVTTLSAILLALVLLRLPPPVERPRTPLSLRLSQGAIAGAGGALVTVLLLAVTARPFDDTLTQQFLDLAPEKGHGDNVVNVILVDFRAFDTLGEITVITVAALTAYALIRRRRSGGGGRP